MMMRRRRAEFGSARLVLAGAALLLLAAAVASCAPFNSGTFETPNPPQASGRSRCALRPGSFVASIDTMKESMDTSRYPLTDAQIAQDVNVSAGLNTTYITVDVHWDYPRYMQQWVDAVRRTGRHVWFRIHPNAWEGSNGIAATLTPAAYLAEESTFISGNARLFQPGDILDMNPEPENSPYWAKTYGRDWTANPAALADYNQFFGDVSDIASSSLVTAGVTGVVTTARSTNSWFAQHPDALFPSTVARMGRVTIDSYPDEYDTAAADAVRHRLDELSRIEAARPGVPIVIGEFGYSNKINVDDATQEAVVFAELSAIASDQCVQGLNYWVGAGTESSGGFTHLFSGATNSWTPRPAATDLAAYFARQAML